MKIDLHCHYFAEEFITYRQKMDSRFQLVTDAQGRKGWSFRGSAFPLLTPEERLAEMDSMGVDVEVLSMPSTNDVLGPDPEGIAVARACNDVLAGMAKTYPERFKSLAVIPLENVDAAIKELGRAIDELGMNGVCIGSNIRGKVLNSPEFMPFYEEMDRRGLTLVLHPGEPAGKEVMGEFNLVPLVGYPFETTLAAVRMTFSGIFEKYPNMKLVLPHLGGALPYLFHRIDYGYTEKPGTGELISKPPSEFFKHFYYDTAIAYHQPMLKCSYDTVGADQIVFGTDHPFGLKTGFAAKSIDAIEKFPFTPEEREKVYCTNTQKLLVN